MALTLCPKSPSRPQTPASKSKQTRIRLRTSAEYAEPTAFRSSSTTQQQSQSTHPLLLEANNDWWINTWESVNTYQPDPIGVGRMEYTKLAKRIRTGELDPIIEFDGIRGPLSEWRRACNDALKLIYREPEPKHVPI